MNAASIFAVACGGALGSVARYLVGIGFGRMLGLAFPWGTLFINVLGSFAIGALIEIFALRAQVSPAMRAFLVVGICGGFTTFSTFSLDVATLIGRGDTGYAAAYTLASVVLSIGALYIALAVMRAIF